MSDQKSRAQVSGQMLVSDTMSWSVAPGPWVSGCETQTLEVLVGDGLLQVLRVQTPLLRLHNVLHVLLLVQQAALLPPEEGGGDAGKEGGGAPGEGGRGAGGAASQEQEEHSEEQQPSSSPHLAIEMETSYSSHQHQDCGIHHTAVTLQVTPGTW